MPAFTLSMPSLPTDTIPYLDFILQPIAVLIIVAFISISYKRCKTLNVSPAAEQFIVDSHAIATELCQLLLVVLAPPNTATVIRVIILLANGNNLNTATAAFIMQTIVVGSLLFHSAAIMMVGVIEGWILLDRLANFCNYQPFLITRNCSNSLWRYFQKETTSQRPRISTQHDVARALRIRITNRAALRRRLAKLYYLDLAGLDGFRARNSHLHKSSIISTPMPKENASKKTQGYAFVDLPTPPDSRETKRVKWASSVTVFSPSEAEGRQSLL